MIPCKQTPEHPLHWKKLFAKSYVGIKELANYALDDSLNTDKLAKIDSLFPIQISQEFLKNHSLDGPVLLQYLPNPQELINPPGYTDDPVGDISATLQPGVIKKYKHRVLLITNNTCPIHCRYCFRKDFPYPQSNPNTHQFRRALEFCQQDKTINEIILSGGDPLSLEDETLKNLFTAIEKISHIKTIRIHTKFPSVFPQRITDEFISTLKECSLNKVCVFHINHPDEITQEFCDAVLRIKQTDTMTLNQSVLLKNVNDEANTLINLSNKLFATGILPYYLHKLDAAKGTHHFKVSDTKAEQLIELMKISLPGYLVPKLAEEIAGQNSKSY